jgi:glutaredoxin
MKRDKAAWLSGLGSLLIMASAHAQLYKWVAPDGSVSYSDQPPPASVSKVERKFYAEGPSLANLPYELSEAVKNSPVTLYAAPNCAPCDAGRTLLNTRGIPYSEKTVASNNDIEHVRQIAGTNQLPVMTVGHSKQIGFEPGGWGNALTAAGYPTTNQLPNNYHNPAPEPATPPAAASEASKASNTNKPGNPADTGKKGIVTPPPPLGNPPPGFQF